jgi:hypothetical protein
LHKISQAEVIPESFAPAAESRKDCFLFSCRLGLLLSGYKTTFKHRNKHTHQSVAKFSGFPVQFAAKIPQTLR